MLSNKIGEVVPYIGTWIETRTNVSGAYGALVVPYIGTWIETEVVDHIIPIAMSYLI